MERKKKICAGCLRITYIYKNIDGNKYCKSCTYKLQPPKQIKKVSEKQVFKIKLKKDLLEEDKEFYLRIWEKKVWKDDFPGMIPDIYPLCECCDKNLGSEPNLMFFHHILEKRNYPEFRHSEWNIAVVCPECHNSYESNPDSVPYLKKIREILLNNIEKYK